ncbi:MAG: cation:proton antiporter, partial [Gammaproteobacteria bacterium]
MDTIVILTAFIAGLGFSKLGLPPLLGYLAAGFVLGVTGQVEGALLNSISELGITLLLFTIGLKLDVRSILLPRIWGVACTHMLITVVLVSLTLTLLSLTGVAALAELDWNSRLLLALAFSFSSTVFAVKVLDEQGDMNSLHGNTAIGILVIQDIIAVLYMVWLEGVLPQWYAAGLLLLILLRIPLIHLLKITGHNELLTLLGFALALGGYGLFEMAGLKGGVGALFLGIVIAGHSKSNELARNLMQFKELFLVGFFLTIGLNGLPDGEQWLLAMIFAIVGILFKPLLFILLFSRSHLKVR